MRSQLRFFMHPDDEAVFLQLFASNATIAPDSGAVTHLLGRHVGTSDLGCVQFWRSQLQGDVLTEGRIALATTGFGLEERLGPSQVEESEHLYRYLRRELRKRYTNHVVRWWNPSLPPGPTNPTRLDSSLWLGPEALRWWRSSSAHLLKSTLQGAAQAVPFNQGA